ncbi:MAG: hypothetical protein ACP5GI_06205 [Sulfolobales archaeon]
MLSKEEIELFKTLWEKGVSTLEISRLLKINHKHVYIYAKVYGLKSRKKSARAKINENDIKVIAELRKKGLKIRDIASLMKVSPRTIAAYLKALGMVSKKQTKCPEISKETLLDAISRGLKDREIAETFGVSLSCIYKYKKLYGISKRSLRRQLRDKKISETIHNIIRIINDRGFVTSSELRKKIGVVITKDLLERILSIEKDIKIIKIKYTSTHKFTIFNPRLGGVIFIYKDHSAVARYLLSNIVDKNAPLRVIKYLFKLNKIPQELLEKFIELSRESVSSSSTHI